MSLSIQVATQSHRSAKAPHSIDYSTSQLPVLARHPCGGADNLSRTANSNEWLYVDQDYLEACPP